MLITNKEEYRDIPISRLGLSARSYNVLRRAGCDTLYLVIENLETLPQQRHIGSGTMLEIKNVLENIEKNGIDSLSEKEIITQTDDQATHIDENNDWFLTEIESTKKGFDFFVIDILVDKFKFKPVRMADWFGLTKQSIYNVMEKRSSNRYEKWTGKELNAYESDIIRNCVEKRCFDYADDNVKYIAINNMKDDCACIFVYDNEIKCFFLNDLPTELQSLIVHANMHKLSLNELSSGSDGKIVYILTKPYFLPNDAKKFHNNANLRGMTSNEYSVFLSGYEMTDTRTVKDDQIIEFLKENMRDGKVYISSDPKNQWIRSIASRNGYGMRQFVELYGFEYISENDKLLSREARERHVKELKKYIVRDNVVYIPIWSNLFKILHLYACNKGMTLDEYLMSIGYERTLKRPVDNKRSSEDDMVVRYSNGSFEDKLFARYPLIGSKLLSKQAEENLNTYSKEYIEKILKRPEIKLSLRAKMQITIAVINYAKDWESGKNENFWDYIVLRFGYRDSNGNIVRLLKNAVEDSMRQNKRLFIEDKGGREFKSTILVHALSTKKSWMALFDFLFDFYKNNLNWNYVPGDAIFDTMVRVLQKKLNGNDEEAELIISSKVYLFQEGIRKLILFRPVFTSDLFEKLIQRIDSLINFSEMPIKNYEDRLCEEWFKNKITAITRSKKMERRVKNIQTDVAVDYSGIRAKYILKKDNVLNIVLPDIRLKNENKGNITLNIICNGRILHKSSMSWYGNELGRTLKGEMIPILDLLNGCEKIAIRVQIICDDDIIYDSEDLLNRKIILFASENEVSEENVAIGKYMVVLPASSNMDIENGDSEVVDSFCGGALKLYYIELNKGYIICVNGHPISFDAVGGGEMTIVPPEGLSESIMVTVGTDECYLARKNSGFNIILGNEEYINRFIIEKNRKRMQTAELIKTKNQKGWVLWCPIEADDSDISHIKIINMEKERLLFDRKFIIFSDAECVFDRSFYYSAEDYKNASVYIRIDEFNEEISFTQLDDEVRAPFRNGELHLPIPKIRLNESTGTWLNDMNYSWYIEKIPQNSVIEMSSPANTEIAFYAGGKRLIYDGSGILMIGNILQSLSANTDLKTIELEMEVKRNEDVSKYKLCRIFFKEGFLGKNEFVTKDNRLIWNHGGGFIGKEGRVFTLSLYDENDSSKEFQLSEETESVEIPEDMDIGRYRFTISIDSGGLFKRHSEVIAEGDCILGDPNILRFKNIRLVIDSITDEFREEQGHIPITPCYIDRIEFMGIEETSEGVCPVYSGVLYAKSGNGNRYDFSYDDHINDRGIAKMMVNPVRIVYVNDAFLCITDPDGDGLYYYFYYDRYKDKRVYALTDRKYTNATRHKYSNADLYAYRTERTKDV